MEQTTELETMQQYLTFFVAGDECAIGLLRVREIIEYGSVTHVPTTPACIRGVANLRGSVLPVIDLGVKFGLPPSVPSKQTCIVVTEVEMDGRQIVLGVMTDAVNQVIELDEAHIQAPPSFGTRVRVDFLRGLGQVENGFVLLLDIDRLLTAEELLAATPEAAVPAAAEPGTAAPSPQQETKREGASAG